MVGSHAPAAWHGSSAVHTTGVAPAQVPAWQVPVVHVPPLSQTGPVRSLHVPSTSAPAATEQALHGPASHAVLQQTPLWQKPLAQCGRNTSDGLRPFGERWAVMLDRHGLNVVPRPRGPSILVRAVRSRGVSA